MSSMLPPSQRKRSLFLPLPGTKSPMVTNENGEAAMSPMTELAVNFHYNVSCEGSTPRRRLSLSDCRNTPTPKPSKLALSTESLESGIEIDGFSNRSSFDDSPSVMVLQSKSNERCKIGSRAKRKHIFRRSSSSPVANEPLWFKSARDKLADEHRQDNYERSTSPIATSPTDSNCSEVLEINCIGDAFQPINNHRDSKDENESIPFDLNRSLSAPPALDSMEKYFEDLIEEKEGVYDSDFIDEDNHDGVASLPSSFSGLMNNPFLCKNDKPTRKPLAIKKPANDENICPKDSQSLPSDGIFRKPKSCGLKTSRSISFSIKRQDPPRDYSPVSRKRFKQRSQSVHHLKPMALHHMIGATSPVRLLRTQSLGNENSPGFDSMIIDGDDKNVIGDNSRSYALPIVKGQHSDLKCIKPETVAKLLNNEYVDGVDNYVIIDCRYPYEYEAGHIKGAINLYMKEEAVDYFLKEPKFQKDSKSILIFHCEFSSKRGPNMSRFLRNKDRDLHRHCYPKLYYPEIYILNGGYKDFYNSYENHCDPIRYLPMADTNHAKQFRFFAKRSKSWSENSTALRHRTGLRY